MNALEQIEKRKAIIRAQLKTCLTPESTVEMAFLLIEENGSEKFLEGYKSGVEHMAARVQDIYGETKRESALSDSSHLTADTSNGLLPPGYKYPSLINQ